MAGAQSGNMIRNALTMMVGTLASRVLGLLREVITAACFGAGRSLDAFFAAYTIANLGRQLLAEGALSAAFVPVFSQVVERQGRENAELLARQALSVILCASAVAVGLGILFSPQLISFIAPGFDSEKYELTVVLTRQLFPFLTIISAAALAMGVLNSMNCFFVPALAPALSNVIYITITLLLASRLGVKSLVWAVLLGGAANLLFQWSWAAADKKMVLIPSAPDLKNPELRRMLTLFLPYAAGLSLNQLNPVLSRFFGSFLADGSISMLNYANRVVQLPLGLVVIAVSQAVLPELSRCIARGGEGFSETLRDALRFSLFVIVPVTAGMMMMSSEIVHFLFFRAAFGEAAWRGTSTALFYSSLALPGMACSTVVMRALFARSLSRQAVMTTVSNVTSLLLFSAVLISPLQLGGVALAGSLAFTVSSCVGIRLLERASSSSCALFQAAWCAKIFFGTAAMAAVGCAFRAFFPYPSEAGIALRALWLMLVGGVCMAVYAAATLRLRCEEWNLIFQSLRKRRRLRGEP